MQPTSFFRNPIAERFLPPYYKQVSLWRAKAFPMLETSQLQQQQKQLFEDPATRLAWFWWMRGYYSEGRRWINSALAKIEKNFLPLRMKAFQGLGHIVYAQGDLEQAAKNYDQSLALSCQAGDKDGMLWALACMGLVASKQGNVEQAMAYYERSMSLRYEVDDNWHIAWLLSVFGDFLAGQGNHNWGEELIEESIALHRHLQNPWGKAISLYMLARSARFQGDYKRSQNLNCKALKLRRTIGDKLGIARCLVEFAETAASEGQNDRAERLFGAGKSLYEMIGDFTALTDQPLLKDLLRNEKKRRAAK